MKQFLKYIYVLLVSAVLMSFNVYSNNNDSSTVNIYPNPVTTESFIVKTNVAIQKIEILNVLGKIIYIDVPDNPDIEAKINLQFTGNGIYILRLETTTHDIIVKKFIVK